MQFVSFRMRQTERNVGNHFLLIDVVSDNIKLFDLFFQLLYFSFQRFKIKLGLLVHWKKIHLLMDDKTLRKIDISINPFCHHLDVAVRAASSGTLLVLCNSIPIFNEEKVFIADIQKLQVSP